MKKYNEPIYNRKCVQEALKISWLERFLLLFIRPVRVENEETVSHYKQLFGKFYLMDFKIKNLFTPQPKKGK